MSFGENDIGSSQKEFLILLTFRILSSRDKKGLMKCRGYALVALFLLLGRSQGQTSFTGLNIDFSEYAFATLPGSSPTGYNIINDSTGAELTSDNGDSDDIFISVSSSVPAGAAGAFANVDLNPSGGLRSNHGFGNSFASTYSGSPGNNPGTLITQTIRMTFADYLTITDFKTDFRSLNTAGITWEHSRLSFLKSDGSYFSSPAHVTGDHGSWSIATNPLPSWNIGNETAGNGASGSPSLGFFVAAANDTVTNVGTALTTSGGNGSKEAFTSTNGNSFLDYDDVGLAPGTQIGGFEWTVFLEDTRGTSNSSSQWTATQTYFEFSGSVPEPSSGALVLLATLGFLRRSR